MTAKEEHRTDPMSSVLQLSKRLSSKPQRIDIKGFIVRNYAFGDEAAWLDLRDRAFAREKLGVRKWLAADFQAEFIHKWWWDPSRMWLAEWESSAEGASLVGSVTLAMRGEASTDGENDPPRPVVHWLMVSPAARKQGLGRMLLSHLEVAVWESGYRQIWLETHVAWRVAAEFYRTLGYVASRDPISRDA